MAATKETSARRPGMPSPSDQLPELDRRQRAVLRDVGREWGRVIEDPESWRDALPVDPTLEAYPTSVKPSRFGRFVPVTALSDRGHSVETVEETTEAERLPSDLATVGRRARHLFLGHPLRSSAIAHERMRKLIALPVLSADALSSVAYGPEAMLAILVLAGAAGLRNALPIAGVIALLMLAVGVSYRQTIRAYPKGGGSYIVASGNLGRVPGLFAAAGLLVDYILTVAVSVSAGVAALTSAVPSLAGSTVPIGLGVIAVLLAGNLRGVRQAGVLFAAPTYAFILAIALLIGFGLADAARDSFHAAAPPHLGVTQSAGLLLILRAFASGATAMTGVEAISDAVPTFTKPEWRNARTTLTIMIAVLIVMFVGTIVVLHLRGVVPNAGQTALSQLARQLYGPGVLYGFTQAATAAILLLAANTAFNDFPRVLFYLARDRQAPRMFLRMGDRLAFSNGIIVLSVTAALLYTAFGGKTDPLIPLFAVGVFLAFTLSQAGMVALWWHERGDRWRRSLTFNAVGMTMSGAVFVTAGVTKFLEGAWVAVVAVLLFVGLALAIRRHYDRVAALVELGPDTIEVPQPCVTPPAPDEAADKATDEATDRAAAEDEGEGEGDHDRQTPHRIRHLTVVPLSVLDRPAMRALAYATSLGQPVLVVHVSPTEDEAKRFGEYWQTWGAHLPLEVVVSPYRTTVTPLVDSLEALAGRHSGLILTVILPEVVVEHWWQSVLHDRIAARLRRMLRHLPSVVITSVPFHL
ncbi:amino acid permease-associated region [Catenulispora acidiphila DSM 44928]|uniref:Amino acid permease-associated region n=1 Tax=Catenulispora acidiphila (strain DSM 44928 / JCM 14897 / NBRC 102108 / NRRL B-24433 / ID139908) TaxID=479433 RepID=C7Q8Z4_CATAD|nr:APC family permease [Catenulispora acidiphila]ACU72314.1 amino acid permease-associated region [Catenulispora acidiphila DSM 44928]